MAIFRCVSKTGLGQNKKYTQSKSRLTLNKAETTNAPDYHLIIEELMKRCDAVQTTGKNLEERYGHLNEHFLIFPNLIDEVRSSFSESDDKFTIIAQL